MKRVLIAAVGLAVAAIGLAQLSKYKDWAKSGEAYFLTPAEKEEWSRVHTDDEAASFIASYWVKRDPNPSTAANEFRDEINRRIAAADEQFKMRSKRGSETVRGRLLVTLGLPSRVSSQRAQESAVQDTGGLTAPTIDTRSSSFEASPAVVQTWTYTKDKFDPALGLGELKVRINIDPQRGTEDLMGSGAVDRAIAKIAEKSIVSGATSVAATAPAVPPAATGAPAAAAPPAPSSGTGAGTAPAAPPAAPPAAAAAAPPAPAAAVAIPAAARSVLEALSRDAKGEGMFWSGEFRSVTGEPFYAMQFYVTAEQAAQPLKFGGIVWNDAKQTVASYWEDANFIDVKSGPRTDKVYDRSVALGPGSYRGAFGLFPAADAAPLATASADFKLESRAGEFGVSQLILANTLTPLTKRPAPTDPFVFGMEKPIKVEPKGDRQFAKEDSLWYFYTVSNPVLPVAAAAPAPTPAPAPTTPAPATTPGAAPAAPAAPEVKPRIMTRISVLRDGKDAFQPLTQPAELQLLGPAYYASGSEIPLASFEPGYYTFSIQVRDLNAPRDSAAFKGLERKQDFVVLNADGTLPPRPKPAAAKPKPPAKKG